jgi:CDP-diacylglycerol---serine O-phosphatidyltransferase
MAIKRHIPNFITLLNLVSGCIAIIFIFDDNLPMASYLIFIAAVFDFLDGMAARVLKVKSDIGKELDSLADIISFGLVPGFIMMKLLESSLSVTNVNVVFTSIIPYFALLIPVFSALRLAKFNIDSRQTKNFIGLPTPANAILIASLPLLMAQKTTLIGMDLDWFVNLIGNLYNLIGFTVVLSYLLVAELPLFSLKISKNEPAKNRIKYFFIGISVLLFALFYFVAIPFIMALYILLSLLFKSKI